MNGAHFNTMALLSGWIDTREERANKQKWKEEDNQDVC